MYNDKFWMNIQTRHSPYVREEYKFNLYIYTRNIPQVHIRKGAIYVVHA